MMSTDESCPTSHRVYRLSIKKNKGRKRRNFVVNKENLAKELGPGKKDWFEDATARKLLKKKLDDKKTPTTKSHLTLPCLSPIESSSSCSIPSTFQHLLSSQKSSPNSPLAWVHLSLGESPDVDSVDDTCNKQSRAVPTQSGIVKSLGLDLNDSVLSWTGSLATPTAHSPATISAIENSPSPVSKQKGLPRVLFSPGPALTDDELGHTLDFTSEDNTDEESEPFFSADKCYNNVKPVCIKAEQTPVTSHVKSCNDDHSRNLEVACESNNEELYSIKRSQDIQPVLNVQNVKDESKYEISTQDSFSMPLFSQDENFSQKVVSVTGKGKTSQNTSTDDRELVNIALSDFFDPPSSAVGKRRCAPSRGKKRKSEDKEHLMLELFMDSDNASGKRKRPKCLDKSNKTSPASISNRKSNENKESLQGLLNANVQGTEESYDCSKEIKLSDSTVYQSNPDKSISKSVAMENQYNTDTSTPVHHGKKVLPDLLFKHIERGESWTDGESFNSTPVNTKKVLKSILSSEKKGRSSGKKKHVRFALETKSSLKRNCRKLSETEQTFDNEWMNVDQEDSLLLGTQVSSRDIKEKQDECNMKSEQNVKLCDGKQYECNIKSEQNVKLYDGKQYECNIKSEQDVKPCDSEELKSTVKSTLETSDDLFSQVSPTALRDMCEAASSEISIETGKEKVDESKPSNYLNVRSKVNRNDSITNSVEKETLNIENSYVEGQRSSQREDEVQNRTASSSKLLSGKLLSLGSKAKRFLYPTTKQISTSCPKTVFAFAEQTKNIQKVTNNTELVGISKDTECSVKEETVGECHISRKPDSVTDIDENRKLLGFERFSSMGGSSTEDQENQNLMHTREDKGNSNIDQGVDISASSTCADKTGLNIEEQVAVCETSTDEIMTGVTTEYIEKFDLRTDKAQNSEGWLSNNDTAGISESRESTLTKAADDHVTKYKDTVSLHDHSYQKAEAKFRLKVKESITLGFMAENICSVGFTKASGGKVDISAQALESGSKLMIDASEEKAKDFGNKEDNHSYKGDVNEMLVHSKIEPEKITAFHSVMSIGDGNHQTLKPINKDFDTCMDGTGEKCSKSERCREEYMTSNVRGPCQSYTKENEHSEIVGFSTAADTPIHVSDNDLVKARQPLSNEHARIDLNFKDENPRQEMEFSCSTNEIENVETNGIYSKYTTGTEKCESKSDVANDQCNVSAKETNHIDNSGALTCSSSETSMIEKDVLNLSKLEKKCIVVQKQFSGFSTAGGKLIQPSDSSITKAEDLMADVNSFEAEDPYLANSVSSTNYQNTKMRKEKIFEAVRHGENLNNIKKSNVESNGSSLKRTADSVQNIDQTNTSTRGDKELTTNTSTGNRNVENHNINVMTLNTVACDSDADIRNESRTFGGFHTAKGQDIILSKESIKKAMSVMAECDHSVDQKESIESANNMQNNAVDLIGSSTCHDLAEQLSKDSMYSDWSKLPEFGFQTAGGKNVSLKVESLSKAKKLISETSKLFDEMEVTNNIENMCNGVAKNILEKSGVQTVSPSCSAVKNSNVMTGFSTAGGKHVKLSEESLRKAKTLVEESQEHMSEELPPLTGFEEMLKKVSPENRGHKAANQGGYSVSNENILKAKDLFSDINSLNMPVKKSHVGTSANQFKPVVQSSRSCVSSNKKQVNTMKSSFNSSRFPPGANIPKGFRPFKPPKLTNPVLQHEEKQAKLSIEHRDVCKSGDLKQKTISPKNKLDSNDFLKEPVSPMEISTELEHTVIDTNCKNISDQELDAYLMDDLFCEELEPSQKFSPDSGKVIGMSRRKCIKKQIETKNITFSDLDTGKRNNCETECYPKIQNMDVKFYEQGLSPIKTSNARDTSNSENSKTLEMETSTENDKISNSTSKPDQLDKFDTSNSEVINKSIFDVDALMQFDDDDPLLQLAMMEDLDDSAYMDVSQERTNKEETKKENHTVVKQLSDGGDQCKSWCVVIENEGDGNNLNNTKGFPDHFEETVVTGSADVMFQGFKSASGKLFKLSDTALKNARKCLTDCSNEDDELNFKKNPSFKFTNAVDPNKYMSSNFNDHTVSNDLSICISSSTKDSGIVSADNITITQEFDSTHTSKTNFDVSDYHSLDGMKQDTEVESKSVVNVNQLKNASGNDVGISSEALDETRKNLESMSGTNSGHVSSVNHESLLLGVGGVKYSVETTSAESEDKMVIGRSKSLLENSLLQDNTHFALEELMNSQIEFTQIESVENVCCSASSRNIPLSCCNTDSVDKGRSFNSGPHSMPNRIIPITCHQNSKKLLTDHSSDPVGPEKITPLQRFSSFQSTSGKSVHVSEKSMQLARERLESVVTDFPPLKSTSGKSVIDSVETLQPVINTMENVKMKVSPFQSGSGKSVSISEKALQQARNTMENVTMDVSPFQSASGKSIGVSEKALQQARNTMENVTMDVSPFQSASGKSVSVSEKALQQARNTMENVKMDVSPFQSASGKSVSVSEKALQQARNTMENVKMDVSPFQSASGKSVSVSEKALQQARNIMENVTMDVSPFQSASGKSVSVSEKALQQARNTMENVKMDVSPFQSASGKSVNISEKALQQAINTMENVKMDVSPFQSASGKSVNISEKALQQAINTMENVTMDVSSLNFQSASGKSVSVSEKALQQARNTMENVTMDVSPFQSASGKSVSVSEKALQQAINTMENVTMDVSSLNFQSASGKSVSVSEKALQQARNTMENVTMDVSPFQSASGKSVSVSEKALQQARNTMENVTMDVSSLNFQSASGKSVSVSEKALQQARNTMENVTMDVSPFQSASEKSVGVSEKALQQARNTMENVKMDVSPFQIASGKSVSVSEKALQQARNTMENVTMDVSPFQSASGKSVGVSEKALQTARSAIENSTANISLIQSDSRKSLSISEKAIVHPRKSEISAFQDVLVKRSVKPRNNKKSIDVVTPSFSAFCQKRDLQHKILETTSNRMDIEKVLNESLGNQGDRHTDRPLTKQLTSRGILQTNQPTVRLHNQGVEVFYQPEDFLEEMEIPPKRRKLGSGSELENDGRYSKQEMFIPLKTTPEAVTKDRMVSSYNLKPLYSYTSEHSNREKAQCCNVNSQQNNMAQQPAKAVFKTPYKTSGVQRETESADQKKTKSQTPVYLPKAVAKNKTFLNKKIPLAAHEISKIEKDSANAVNRYTHNDIDQVQESRKLQDDIIQKKEKTRIKPADGRLYKLKNQKRRLTLKGVFELSDKSSSELELLKQGVQRSTLSVRSGNASQHRFHLPDFYNGFKGHVYVGDGAFLVPDDQLNAGKKEFYRAFLTVEGVDKKLISEAWFYNHYRWIVWKLASYEVVSPGNFAGRSLNPEMVMLQMKYRYDREIDKCQRSALKKIMERDDTASKRMVLCVSDVSQSSTGIATPTNTRKEESSINKLDVQTSVELTDGWYSVQAKLDIPLQDMVNNSKIRVGDKLCTSGAELVGPQEAYSPLEAPPDLLLKLNANSTRPVGWDARLGFQTDLRPLCVPLTGLCGEGGTVGCLDVVVARKFPVMYMEKYQDGSCVFRSRQAEDKFEHQHEQQRQIEMEKVYSRLQKEYEQDEITEKCVTKRKWTKAEVEHLQTGQELYEACNSCRQSEMLEEYLSEDQMSLLIDYRRCVQEEKRQKLHAEFQKRWQSTSERNVVPLMKMRVVGCSKKDLDTKASAVVSVWRPTPQILDLKEGGRYKIFGLTASSARSHYSQHNVQLTANRQTRFHDLEVDENLLDLLYEPRELMSVADIRCRKGLFGEVDFVGVVLSVSSVDFAENGRHQDFVFVADTAGGILGIKFWGGIKNHSIEDLIKEDCIICATNLLDKSNYRGSLLPMLECSSEFTSLTQKPQNPSQRQEVEKLQSAIKNKDFMEKARQHLTELKQKLIKHTPEKLKEIPGSNIVRSTSPNNIPVSTAVTPGTDTTIKRTVYQAKMARLLNYGSPTPLSPISTVSSRRVSKAFKSPLVQNRAGQS